jgi:hypothetical protein
LELAPVKQVKICVIINDGDIFRLFPIEYATPQLPGHASLGLEAHEMTTDNPVTQQGFPEAIYGGIGCLGHQRQGLSGHEVITRAITVHAEIKDDRLRGQISDPSENFG